MSPFLIGLLAASFFGLTNVLYRVTHNKGEDKRVFLFWYGFTPFLLYGFVGLNLDAFTPFSVAAGCSIMLIKGLSNNLFASLSKLSSPTMTVLPLALVTPLVLVVASIFLNLPISKNEIYSGIIMSFLIFSFLFYELKKDGHGLSKKWVALMALLALLAVSAETAIAVSGHTLPKIEEAFAIIAIFYLGTSVVALIEIFKSPDRPKLLTLSQVWPLDYFLRQLT